MNQLLLVGRLVREVEIRQVGGHRVVNNCIAVSRKYRDRKGEVPTDFIPIVAWDHWADVLSQYVTKGQRVGIVGRLESRRYTNQQNQSHTVLECLVFDVTLLENKGSSQTTLEQVQYETLRQQYEVPQEMQLMEEV